MLDAKLVKKNLKKHLSQRADKDYLIRLKELVNYNEDTKFKDLNKLTSAIKYSDDSDDAVYCLTILNNIRSVIEMNHPPVDASKTNITIEEFVEWIVAEVVPNTKEKGLRYTSSLPYKEVMKSKPLKMKDTTLTDWIELSSSLELTRHVSD